MNPKTVTIVSGGCVGDEGKANVFTCCQKDGQILVRVQGGSNAGNSVKTKNNETLVFHALPAYTDLNSTNIKGIGVFGTEYVLDIECLVNEVEKVRELGFQGIIFVGDNVTPILDCDVANDQKNKAIGSTAKGIGPAHIRRMERKENVSGTLRQVLNCIECENKNFNKLSENDYKLFRDSLKKLKENDVKILSQLEVNKILNNEEVMVMGAHGYGLSSDSPRYPYTTTSDVNPMSSFIKHCPVKEKQIITCVKLPYMTRVGTGSCTPYQEVQQWERAVFACFMCIGKEYGATTGRLRKVCWLNLAEIRKHCILYGVDYLALTKCDLWDMVGKEIKENFPTLRKYPNILDFVGCSMKGLDDLFRRYNENSLECVFITGYEVAGKEIDYPYPQYLEQDGFTDFYGKNPGKQIRDFSYKTLTKKFLWPKNDKDIENILTWIEEFTETKIKLTTHGPSVNDVKIKN